MQIEAEASKETEYVFKPAQFGQDEKRVAAFAIQQISKGGCYCVLVNTVKQAQRIYQEIMQARETDTDVLLFHAHFTMGERDRIEKLCIKKFGKEAGPVRPAKAILIATQVVEQSLDIDFDGMISELAPVDLLLQRAGRVHRHRNRVRPERLKEAVIHVVVPDENVTPDPEKRYGPSGYIYAPFLLMNTEELLKREIKIQVPKDMRSIISKTYENITEENMEVWQERAFNQQLMASNADKVSYPVPAEDYFFPTQANPEYENLNIDDGFDSSARAATRLGEPTFRIAFTSTALLLAARGGNLNKEQQREILLSSVSLRLTPEIQIGLRNIDQIQKGALYGCYITDQCDIVPIGSKNLRNSPEMGVYWEE